ncbi:hypothetical protein SAMN05216241_101171 [Limimonas halophila]|uniref:SmpA / OmlA family protein n=1 Tax=Limimonas halophila TaxID=1082479 RepID=A0A1G7LA10_9PROT|nr:hypothetical protein [Limimonas halophila]SDF46216.1 hypothetical protein SAMN05216241_101171 [Limimonas halophila]
MRAGVTRALAACLLAAAATGCEQVASVLKPVGGESGGRPADSEAAQAGDDPTRRPEVARVPPAETAAVPAEPDRADSGPPVPRERPVVSPIEFARLKGLTPADARALLGEPDGRGETPPATVWTYRQGPCRLKLFFYYDLTKKTQRTLTVELNPGSDAAGARAACLLELARRGTGDPSGPHGGGSATAS